MSTSPDCRLRTSQPLVPVRESAIARRAACRRHSGKSRSFRVGGETIGVAGRTRHLDHAALDGDSRAGSFAADITVAHGPVAAAAGRCRDPGFALRDGRGHFVLPTALGTAVRRHSRAQARRLRKRRRPDMLHPAGRRVRTGASLRNVSVFRAFVPMRRLDVLDSMETRDELRGRSTSDRYKAEPVGGRRECLVRPAPFRKHTSAGRGARQGEGGLSWGKGRRARASTRCGGAARSGWSSRGS
jgi:hypothetical protein